MGTSTTDTVAPPTTNTAPAPAATFDDDGTVTPTVENEVMATTWKTFAAAFAEDDTSSLAAVSTPEVQETVAGYFSCGCTPWPAAVSSVSFAAAPQTTYPLSFLAEVEGNDYDGKTLTKEVVFNQTGAGQPWLVAFLGYYIGGTPLLGATPTNLLQAPSALPQNPASLAQEYASFFQEVDQTDRLPALPSGFVQGSVEQQLVTGSLQGDAYDLAHNLANRYTHRVAAISSVFPAPEGDLVCSTIEMTDVETPTAGTVITQPADQSTWGDLLAPGTYQSLTSRATDQPCFYELTDGSVYLVTDMGGPFALGPGSSGAATPSPPPVTSPPTSTATPTISTGQPPQGVSVVVSVDRAAGSMTFDTNQLDVTYRTCPSFGGQSPTGAPIGVTGVQPGDFVTLAVNSATPCVSELNIIAAPQPPACDATNYGGVATVSWVGGNLSADSILYRPSGPNEPVVGLRWCQAPTVVGVDGAAMTIAQIPPGASVQISMSGNVWVEAIKVLS